MSPEQPNTPSADVQTSDAAPVESGSDEQREGSSPHWWQRLFNRDTGPEATSEGGDQAKADAASQTLNLTTEELERRVQAETDRREAKRRQDERVRARKELRDKDPWAYAEEERQEEKIAEQTNGTRDFFANVGSAHDRVSIDPLVEALPKPEVERIMKLQGAGVGLDGRKLVVNEALKALEKHWRAEGAKDAEGKLRRNPAFRKQVLNEGRATAVEPELLPGAASDGDGEGVSALLRNYYHVG